MASQLLIIMAFNKLLRLSVNQHMVSRFRSTADPLNVSDLVVNGSIHKTSLRFTDQTETIDNR